MYNFNMIGTMFGCQNCDDFDLNVKGYLYGNV